MTNMKCSEWANNRMFVHFFFLEAIEIGNNIEVDPNIKKMSTQIFLEFTLVCNSLISESHKSRFDGSIVRL